MSRCFFQTVMVVFKLVSVVRTVTTIMHRPLRARPSGLSRRVSFLDDEQRHPWLPALLDCYALADTGVSIALRDLEKKKGKKRACRIECDVCCHQPDIPLYPHEVPGLRWYVAEKLEAPVRATVMQQLAGHRRGSPCPFLVERACSVHPVRPIACREYNVFTTPCSSGEDPFFTRREDVLVPLPEYTDRAFAAVAAFYGRERDVTKAVRLIKEEITNLQEYDWMAVSRSIG